jgi:hypothetical protein
LRVWHSGDPQSRIKAVKQFPQLVENVWISMGN